MRTPDDAFVNAQGTERTEHTSPFRHFMFLLTDGESTSECTQWLRKVSRRANNWMWPTGGITCEMPKYEINTQKVSGSERVSEQAQRKCQRHDGIIFFDDSKMTLSFSVRFFGFVFRTQSRFVCCARPRDSMAIRWQTMDRIRMWHARFSSSSDIMHLLIRSNHRLRRHSIGSYCSAAAHSYKWKHKNEYSMPEPKIDKYVSGYSTQ